MDNHNTESTLTVQGFTAYARTPVWILRAGKNLSLGARALYGAIMAYADNDTHVAFPGRELLAEDLGSNVRSITRFVKELEDFGALQVTRRRNKRTGNFYANHYVLIFQDPSAESGTRRDDEFVPVSRPTSLTRPTDHVTSKTSFDREETHFTSETSFGSHDDDHLPKETYKFLRDKLQRVGLSIEQSGDFYHEDTQDLWEDFELSLEEVTEHLPYEWAISDLTQNGKWTVNAKVADQYEAGKELTTLLNTARSL